MTKGKTVTNVPKATLEKENKLKKLTTEEGSDNNNNTTTVVSNLTEEDQIQLEIIRAREELKNIKIAKKHKQEDHEKEIKKKLNDDHNNNNNNNSNGDHHGVKRSKPLQPVTAYVYFKQANSSKTNGWCLEKWKEMDEIAKKPFYDQANKDKERYQQQMSEYEKIHQQVTHHKVQKKDLKKNVDDDDEEDGEKKNTGPKKLTKKEKLAKLKEEKELAKKKRESIGRTAKDIAKTPNSKDSEEEEEEDDEDEEEDDEDNESDEDDEDDEEDEIVDEREIYDDGDDDGYTDMKSGFKSHNPHTQKIKRDPNRRWNK